MADKKVTFDILTRDRSSASLKKIGAQADTTSDRFRRFGRVAGRTAKVAGAALGGAIVALAAGMGKAAKAAAAEEQEMVLLANALRRNAKASDVSIKATEKWITATQNATGVADGELRPALAKLVGATKNTAKAQKLLRVGMDFSAASGKSLDSVSTALTKAYNGNVGALGRLGIKVQDSTKDTVALERAEIALKEAQQDYTGAVAEYGRKSDEAKLAADKMEVAQLKVGEAMGKTKKTTIDFDEAVQRLSDQFGGSAAAAADTAAGRYKILRARFADLVETLGNKLLPTLNAVLEFISDRAVPALETFSAWFQENALPKLREFRAYIEDKVIPAVIRMAEDVLPTLQTTLRQVAADIERVDAAWQRLTGSSDKAGQSVSATGKLIKIALVAIRGPIKLTSQLLENLLNILTKIRESVEFLVDQALPRLQTAYEGAKKFANPFDDLSVPGVPGIGKLKDLFRAAGGPVQAGRPYIVGEQGPELITPTRSGYVHNAKDTARMGGRGGVHIENVYVTGRDAMEAVRSMPQRLEQRAWQAGWFPV